MSYDKINTLFALFAFAIVRESANIAFFCYSHGEKPNFGADCSQEP